VQSTILDLVNPLLQDNAARVLQSALRAASYLKREDNPFGAEDNQGKAEGDVLENLVNALGRMLLGVSAGRALKGNPNGNTWSIVDENGDYSGREALYERLNEVQSSPSFAELKGKLTLASLTEHDTASTAKTDFSDFVALKALSPFALYAPSDDSNAKSRSTRSGRARTRATLPHGQRTKMRAFTAMTCASATCGMRIGLQCFRRRFLEACQIPKSLLIPTALVQKSSPMLSSCGRLLCKAPRPTGQHGARSESRPFRRSLRRHLLGQPRRRPRIRRRR
jgi:hypothetical protein